MFGVLEELGGNVFERDNSGCIYKAGHHRHIPMQPPSTGRWIWAGALCGAGTGRGGGRVVGGTPAGFVVVQPGLRKATSINWAGTMLIGG